MKLLFCLLCCILSFSAFSKTITLTSRNYIILEEAFTGESTAKLMINMLDKLNKEELTSEFYLLLDTPGGSIFSGIKMIDFLKTQRIKVNTISFFAASMGFHTVQGLGTRYLPKNGILMSHLAKGNMSGSFPDGSLNATYNLWMGIVNELDRQIVSRTNKKHTIASYRKLIRGDYWCKGQTCVDQGFADEVVDLVCSNELIGLKTTINNIKAFGRSITVRVTRSKCPIIRTPIKIELLKNKKFINIKESNLNIIIVNEIKKQITNEVLTCGLN